MQTNITRALALASALAALAGSAQAQGRGHGKGHDARRGAVIEQHRGEVERGPAYGRAVPPGLAKKPGQLPPGQYKKRYSSADGARVLSDILASRGYVVTRLVPSGDARTVYYRAGDGTIRRALVRPGADRLTFSNVPAAILQEVMARLY